MKVQKMGSVDILDTSYDVIRAICETSEEQLENGVYYGNVIEPAPHSISRKEIVVYIASGMWEDLSTDDPQASFEELAEEKVEGIIKRAFESELGLHSDCARARFTEGGIAWKVRDRVCKLLCTGVEISFNEAKHCWIIDFGCLRG